MVRPRKHLGQHFLHHRAILEKIADALTAPAGAAVLEIGPGQGGLTRVLVDRGFKVTAIEKDPRLAAMVAELLPGVRVIPGDALKIEWHQLVSAEPWYLIGNIPYNITSPLLARSMLPPLPTCIVFLIQEEVADRIVAEPGPGAYGALSVGIQTFTRAEKLFRVPAGAFHPRPRVDSAVVRLTPLTQPLVAITEADRFRRLVVSLFGVRRKQIGRGLREITGHSAEAVQAILSEVGISPQVRPETLSPAQWVAVYRAVIDADRPPR